MSAFNLINHVNGNIEFLGADINRLLLFGTQPVKSPAEILLIFNDKMGQISLHNNLSFQKAGGAETLYIPIYSYAYYRIRAGRSRHGTGIRNTPPLKKGTSAD